MTRMEKRKMPGRKEADLEHLRESDEQFGHALSTADPSRP
jgi:hypothetical protein